MHEGLELNFASLDVSATLQSLRSLIISSIVIQLNMAVFDQIINLKDLITRLRFKLNLIVPHLVEIASRVELGRVEIISVPLTIRDVTKATPII